MKIRYVRIVYQLSFFLMFLWLVGITAMRVVDFFNVKLFLNSSVLIAIINIVSNHKIASGFILSFVILGLTLFLGRFFCGWICPMGAIMQFFSYIGQSKDARVRYNKNTFEERRRYKLCLLIVVLIAAFWGLVLTGYLDPLVLLTRFFTLIIFPFLGLLPIDLSSIGISLDKGLAFNIAIITSAIVIAAVLLNFYVPRFWCRYVCPLGGIFSLAAVNPLYKMVRDKEKCISCGRCREFCQGGCNIDKDAIYSECLMCMNCYSVCPVGAISYSPFPRRKRQVDIEARRQDISSEKREDAKVEYMGVALSRRDFIVSAFLGVTVVGALRDVKILDRGRAAIIRPPGSLDEDAFLSHCIRCGLCMRSCPTNVIQPIVSSNLELLLTPVLDFNKGFCEYECVNCSKVCPTAAITSITLEQKKAGKGKIGTAFVDKDRCIAWSMGRDCLVCQEVCPVSPKAIYIAENSFAGRGGDIKRLYAPVVDPSLCIGCGSCQYNCPVRDLPAIRVTSIGEVRSVSNRFFL